MSRRKFDLAFSVSAESDIDDILAYTLINWGERQLSEYKKILEAALKAIEKNPKVGRIRDDLRREYRSYHFGKHLIFFRIEGTTVFISRVLHERRDFARGL